MNDKESADAAKAVAEQAEQVKRAVEDDQTLAKPAGRGRRSQVKKK